MFQTPCLSLISDVDRRAHMLSVFDKLNLNVQFFNATTPDELTFEDEEYFKHCDFYEWNINQKAVMATFISHMRMLEYSVKENKNLLIIEDDLEYVLPIDFNNINFEDFDLYNLASNFGCYSYFVSIGGAKKILSELKSKKITQAYDWELSKLETVKKVNSEKPHFIQIQNRFKSNIAPNGYIKY